MHAVSYSRRRYRQYEETRHCPGEDLAAKCSLVEEAVRLIVTIEEIDVDQMFEDHRRGRHGETDGVNTFSEASVQPQMMGCASLPVFIVAGIVVSVTDSRYRRALHHCL